jgi:hypothetical protein
MTRKQIGLIILALALVGFGIYDFWDGYHSGHSVLRGILSVLAGILWGFFCSGWPRRSHREDGPPVV